MSRNSFIRRRERIDRSGQAAGTLLIVDGGGGVGCGCTTAAGPADDDAADDGDGPQFRVLMGLPGAGATALSMCGRRPPKIFVMVSGDSRYTQ